MDWKLALQLAGVVLGLLYLWLEYRADIRLWIVGLVMPLVHGALYYKSGLYADCAMQVYYILAGLYGLCVWAKKPKPAERETGRIARTPARMWFRMAAAYAAIHALLYLLLVRFTDSTVPFWDSLTTALLHHGLLDAFAQIRRAMARVAGRGRRDGGALSLQRYSPHGGIVSALFRAGRRGLPALAQADRAMTKEGRSVERPSSSLSAMPRRKPFRDREERSVPDFPRYIFR